MKIALRKFDIIKQDLLLATFEVNAKKEIKVEFSKNAEKFKNELDCVIRDVFVIAEKLHSIAGFNVDGFCEACIDALSSEDLKKKVFDIAEDKSTSYRNGIEDGIYTAKVEIKNLHIEKLRNRTPKKQRGGK